MCEPQMERMTLLSRGRRDWDREEHVVLSAASPWSHVSMDGLGSAGAGRRGLVLLCSELTRSIELTVETDPSPLSASHPLPSFLVF